MQIVRREVIDALAREQYKTHFKGMEAPIIGGLETARLIDKREFIFRQRMYRVPPLPWHLAAQILDVQHRMRKLAKSGADLKMTLSVFEDAARLSKLAVRPAGRIRRLFWRFARNPFLAATPSEVGRNLTFFSTCMWLDQGGPLQAAPSPASGTSSPSLPASSTTSQPGATRSGGRSLGSGGSRTRGRTSG